jgi:UDP-glucose 4-epimerase
MSLLITGAGGYVGNLLLKRICTDGYSEKIIATDIREINLPQGATFEKLDVRDRKAAMDIFKHHKITKVIHLASIVTPGKKSNRDFEYSVDVEGTKNILDCCVATEVERIVISSSGAAYGYHPANMQVLKEDSPLRGNYEFAYSYHKRLVEEMLAQYRKDHPALKQFIFRISTILGDGVNNQITDLFKKTIQFGVTGTTVPFCIIWDEDLVSCFIQALTSNQPGIYNLTGDGVVTLDERAQMLQKKSIKIPVIALKAALWGLKKLGLTQYGPEQTLFLQYRPVLDNTKLKETFKFTPSKNSKQVFEYYINRVYQKGNK